MARTHLSVFPNINTALKDVGSVIFSGADDDRLCGHGTLCILVHIVDYNFIARNIFAFGSIDAIAAVICKHSEDAMASMQHMAFMQHTQ